MELYLRLSNWLVIRRRETLQLKSHVMQVLQLIWRGLFVDMAQQVIAASELKDERLSARRQAVAETLSCPTSSSRRAWTSSARTFRRLRRSTC